MGNRATVDLLREVLVVKSIHSEKLFRQTAFVVRLELEDFWWESIESRRKRRTAELANKITTAYDEVF